MTTPQTASTPFASASLYVGDLASDITEALLFEIFNQVGPVASVRVCRDAASRRSLGYAYVNFHRVEDAERALDTMNFKPIRNRACRIMWSHRDPSLRRSGVGNIFVKNLHTSIDHKSLYDTFSHFGNILSCKVAVNGKTNKSVGYGFVHYESEESAQNAIARVNGKLIVGQVVTVTMFKSKKERTQSTKKQFTNVYVKNLPTSITEEQFDAYFGKYGDITSSFLALDDAKKPRGFGFVNYKNSEDAAACVEGCRDAKIEDKELYVSRAQKKEEREKELREQFEQMKLERAKKYNGINLYVKNLSDDIDDEKLFQEFAKCGNILSHKVMRDSSTGKSRGFGFVCFSTAEEATKAVTEMNGRMLDSKPLYVALFQRKDVRRAQLEQQYARAKMGAMPQHMYPPQAGPMFYQAGLPQRTLGYYPPQMIPARQTRWQPTPMMNMNAPRPVGLVPAPGRGGAPANAARRTGGRGGGASGGNRAQPQKPAGMPGGPVPQMGPPGQSLKFTNNVRNPPQSSAQHAAPSDSGVQAQDPFLKELAQANEENQKQMIGERLFPLIEQQQPKLAGKITGMLLEMDNGELVHLLESNEALSEKINEALTVLQSHPGALDQAEDEDEEDDGK